MGPDLGLRDTLHALLMNSPPFMHKEQEILADPMFAAL